MDTAKAVLERWISAFNAHDVEALLRCYAETAVNHQISAGEPTRGLQHIKDDFLQLFSAFPDIHATTVHILADGDWAAWEWTGGGTFEGEFLGQAPNGRSYTLQGCGFFRVVDGQIQEQRGYWDRETWYSQLGIRVK